MIYLIYKDMLCKIGAPRYIDLTSACDLPLQVAMSFLSAALWMWRALELLGDNCGGDAWLDMYIFEDIWAAPPASKRLAMQYRLLAVLA